MKTPVADGYWDEYALQDMHGLQRVMKESSNTGPWYYEERAQLLIPIALAVLSALYLLARLIHTTVNSSHSESAIHAHLFAEEDVDQPEPTHSRASKLRARLASHGGSVIVVCKMLRSTGCIALAALSAITYFRCVRTDGVRRARLFNVALGGRWSLRREDIIQAGVFAVYDYASVLSITSIFANQRWTFVTEMHLNFILVVTFVLYAYRDFWPLATFNLEPLDIREGTVLWVRLVILGLTAVVIPLITPRVYTPVDPAKPSLEPSPEQTSSRLSLITFSFLDPLIWKANTTARWSRDQLPPMPDYDRSAYLRKRSLKHLDPSRTPKNSFNIFLGLVKTFKYEYISITIAILLQVVFTFVSPLGVNRLLDYIERGGEGAIVRPWFWIAGLFFGPLFDVMSIQWYGFHATSILLRGESILTQLVFDEVLRMRVKPPAAAKDIKTSESISASTSSDCDESGESSTDGETNRADETSRSSSKGKGKAQPEFKSTAAGSSADRDSDNANAIGKLNNLVSTDMANLMKGCDFLLLILYNPLVIVVCTAFLYTILGWSALLGILVTVLGLPLPGLIAKYIQSTQVEKMKRTDARVQTVVETLNSIRMIKLFGWEQKTNERIGEKRKEELELTKRRQLLTLFNSVINFTLPLITMLVTYTIYTVVMKQPLTASKLFSSMTVFETFRDQLQAIFWRLPQFIEAKVSLGRLASFLQENEHLDKYSNEDNNNSSVPKIERKEIGFCQASFSWYKEGDSATPRKRNFKLCFDDEVILKRNVVNLIVGPTGSGKTSLLMALLGEMHYKPLSPNSWFSLPRANGVAYAAQESWIQNDTIKANILFGSQFDEDRYNKVIYQCGLQQDLALFAAGDLTEVGEKGLTLSGGQKARVTLARAIYSSSEILLLDDVLAALDVHTARWVVQKCLKGDLVRERTVLLITHNIALARPVARYLVSLNLHGRVVSQGPVEETLSHDEKLRSQSEADEAALAREEEQVDDHVSKVEKGEDIDGKLVMAEEVAEGHVSRSAIAMYMSNFGTIAFWMLFMFLLFTCYFLMTVQTWFLGFWASHYGDGQNPSDVNVIYYLSILGLIAATLIGSFICASVLYLHGSLRTSRSIHKQLLHSVTGVRLRWLDTTPTGRIIARCTQDINAVDGAIPQSLQALIDGALTCIIRLGAIIFMSPFFAIPGLIIAILGGACGQVYMKAQLYVKREMSNARSPVLSHFGATVAGIVSIRAYGADQEFKADLVNRIDQYLSTGRVFYNLNRWVCLRIDSLGALFSTSLAIYLFYSRDITASKSSDIGFSLSMAVILSALMLWLVRTYNDFEVSGNSLERIRDYVLAEQEPKPTTAGIPPAYWPSSGELHVEGLSARYSLDGPKVLQDISFHIKAGERVGIVGRTGSGKSSLTLSLLRCIFTEGTVLYDSIPMDKVNLDILRQNITIIPQVPELLSGTLRNNLDPFFEHDDATLNDALRAAGMFSLQQEDGTSQITLDTEIAGGGGNLSVGQRQILALARALVRRSKLLILDEATSAIDFATDSIIQSSLRRELGSEVTLLTVAHRLHTIMDSDKIMVLDAGRLVEFDTPAELLKKDGLFKSLVEGSGDKETLYNLVRY